ncbi:MAG: LuxR family transcriptional regulator [Nitrospinae bacterium]|nr:LuxR family transcriptional regulator [Nitrospinota bacterium]
MRSILKNYNSQVILRIGILLPAALFLVYDLITDAALEGEFASTHFIIEAIVFLFVLVVLIISLRDLADLRTRLQRERTRNKALAGELAAGIEVQMDGWKLTPSEREIAWMIIKGYRFAEIAELRQVKENTTRLQATALYAKAGVHGRGEFVAEIIHHLLAPVLEDSSSDEVHPARRE